MPENPMHLIEGFLLIYLLIGSLLFFLISGFGVVEIVTLAREAKGRPVNGIMMTLGIGFAILFWPRTVRHLWVNRKATGKLLARNLWGRG